MRKRIIALLLAVMMLVSLMPTMAFAEEDAAVSVETAVTEAAEAVEEAAEPDADTPTEDGGVDDEEETDQKVIVDVKFSDLTIAEGTHGHWVTAWSGGDDEETITYFFYDPLDYGDTVTVYYSDGTETTYSYEEFEDAIDYNWVVDQTETSQWGVGEHHFLYYIDNLYGKRFERYITIEESPVEDIVFSSVTVVEGTNGDLRSDEYWDEEQYAWVEGPEYFRYDLYGESINATVYYSDGTETTYSYEDFNNEFECFWDSDQSYENQWGVGEHQFTVRVAGKQYTLNYTVAEDPIENIVFPDVTVIEGTNCFTCTESYWDEELGEYVKTPEYYNYEPLSDGDTITVYYKDGASQDYSYRDFINEFDCSFTSDQSYENQWGVGEHQFIFYVGDKEYTLNYTVEESPIEDIVFSDMTVMEGTNGHFDHDGYWGEEGWVAGPDYFRYMPGTDEVEVTVYYRNGASETCSYWEFEEMFSHSRSSDQSYENQWGAGEHQFTITVYGKAYTLNCIIEEDPIENIVFSELTVIEGTHGYMGTDGYWDDERGEWAESPEYFNYEPLRDGDTITLYYKDGTSETYSYWEFRDEFSYSYSSDQSYENQWGVGEHQFTFNINSNEYERNITIEESPIEDIVFSDVTVMEGTNGYMGSRGYWGEEGWVDSPEFFIYEPAGNGACVTVYYKDGTSETYLYWDFVDNFDCSLSSDQSYENQWGAGEHQFIYTVCGKNYILNYIIEEDPVKEITVKDLVTYEGCNGWYEEDYVLGEDGAVHKIYNFRYNANPEEIIVKYKDGSEKSFSWSELYEAFSEVWIENGQYDETWGVGKHTAVLHVGGKTADYNVIVEESPVEKITVSDIYLVDGMQDYRTSDRIYTNYPYEWDYTDMYWFYLVNCDEFTVQFKDGTVKTMSQWELLEKYGAEVKITDDQSYYNQWGIGKHSAKVSCMGKTADVNVFVRATPVKSMKVAPAVIYEGEHRGAAMWQQYDENGRLQEYWGTMYTDYYPPEVTIEFVDGSEYTCSVWELTDIAGYGFNITDDQTYDKPWGLGKHTATLSYMNAKADFEVTILESPVESIEIADIRTVENSGGYDAGYGYYYDVRNTPITINYKDGTSETYDNFGAAEAATGRLVDEYWGYDYETGISAYPGQGYYNVWGVGTHEACAEFCGVTCVYNVVIEESPVESISVKGTINIVEGLTDTYTSFTDDSGELQFRYYYDRHPAELTVNYKDGSTATYAWDEIQEKTGLKPVCNCAVDAEVGNWTAGEYVTTVEFAGAVCECPVIIEESDVASIKAADITIPAEVDCDTIFRYDLAKDVGNLYYYYLDTMPSEITATYKDGHTEKLDRERLMSDWEEKGISLILYSGQDYGEYWDIGTYQATVVYMGKSATYNVTVTEGCTHSNTETVNAKAATCTEKGYTGDTVCADCGKVISEGKAIKALGHSYKKGVCTRCGAEDPNYVVEPVISLKNSSSSGKPTVSWAAVDNAVKYEVYRATSKTGTFKLQYTTTKTSYTNTGATAGYTYYYKVKAVAADGTKSDFSNMKYTTCDCAQPVVTIACTASSGKPKLSWSAVKGATKYEVYRATSKSGTYSKVYTTENTSYTNTGATAGKTYYYKVKAICGKSSYGNSAYSTIKSITCDCARPVVKITTSNGDPKLSWSKVTGATKYYIYRSTDGKSFSYYSSTTKTSYTNTSAKAGKTYYYKVKAVCGATSYGNSAYSTVKSIKAK